jgi:hypothetical protein
MTSENKFEGVVRRVVLRVCLASQLLVLLDPPLNAIADTQRLWVGGLKGGDTQAFVPEGADVNQLPPSYRSLTRQTIYLLGQDGGRGTAKMVRIDDQPSACLPSIDLVEPMPIAQRQFFLGSTDPIKVAPSRDIPVEDNRIAKGLTTYLHGEGVPVGEIKIVRALATDLDGDGQTEAVVEAVSPNRDYLDAGLEERQDDFSGVAVGDLTPGTFTVRGYAGYLSGKKSEFRVPARFSIVALPDIKGTGEYGVAVSTDGYEWKGITIYAWSKSALRPIENAWCGL